MSVEKNDPEAQFAELLKNMGPHCTECGEQLELLRSGG